MKKIIALFMLSLSVVVASAGTITDVLTADKFAATSSSYTSFSGVTFESAAVYAGQNANNKGQIQLRSKNENSGIVTTTSGGRLESVTVDWADGTMADRELQVYGSNTPYADAADLYAESTQGTLIGSLKYSAAEPLTLYVNDEYAYVGLRSADGALYLNSISVEWSTEGDAVSRPAFSVADGYVKSGTTVTITAEDADAIYYTIDGSEPTTASMRYTEPVVINASLTLSAIACKGSVVSKPTVATYTVAPLVETLAQAKTLTSGSPYEVGFEPVVTYASGANTYIYDAGQYCVIYAYDLGLTAGDVVANGWLAKTEEYNKTVELKPVTMPVAGGKAAVPAPVAVTVDNLADIFKANNQSMPVRMMGMSLPEGAEGPTGERSFVGWMGDEQVVLYNTFKVEGVNPGTYDVYGIITINGTLVQLSPISYTLTDDTRVAAPVFSVAPGEVEQGTEVALWCSTPEATIYYTINGGTPNTKSLVYSTPIVINENTVIQAVAVKDGLDNSPVVSATYTVKVDAPTGDNEAYLIAPEYTGIAGTPLYNADGSATTTNSKDEALSLIGQEFYLYSANELVATVTFTHGTNNYCTSAFGNEVRCYKDDSMVITPAQGFTLKEVYVSTVSNSKGAFSADCGTVEGTGVGASNPITWTGNTAAPLTLHADAQVRFNYVRIRFVDEAGVQGVNVDNAVAPIYYDITGMRVTRPSRGQLVIERRGTSVRKVIWND